MSDFETSGRVWLRGALDENTLDALAGATVVGGAGARINTSENLAAVLGSDGPVPRALAPIMPQTFATRVVSFDKTRDTNWGVPWHQDRVIAVRSKHDVDGFSDWSLKGGMAHCEPPRNLLEQMLFVRIHLDDENSDSGPMQIALGSHRHGLVPTKEAQQIAKTHEIETCIGQRGDILVLKMLTLHRSSAAMRASSRRVLRVDFANVPLPAPLEWSFANP